MTVVKIRRGRVSARMQSPSAHVSNLIRRTVPPSGREYDPFNGDWVISAVRVPGLLAALQAASVEVDESGGVT